MATKTTLDGYGEGYRDVGYIVGTTIDYFGQTFTCSAKTTWDSCKFHLLRTGSPTGNCYAQLYAMTGTHGTDGKPTGSVLATSDAIAVNTISNSAWATYAFTFSGSNKVAINATNYCVVFKYDNGTTGNYIAYGADKTSFTHAGNSFISGNGSTWQTEGAAPVFDSIFYAYGTTVDYSMLAAKGTLTLTGVNATPKSAIKVAITKAEFALTGIGNSFLKGKGMQASGATFTLTGIASSYAIAVTWPISVRTYTLTGRSANLKRGYTITNYVSAFTLTPKNNAFSIGKGLPALTGTFTLSGKDTTFSLGNLWTRKIKGASNWSKITKNEDTWIGNIEYESGWSNERGYLLLENGDYLLQENGYKINISKFFTENDIWTNLTKDESTWTKF